MTERKKRLGTTFKDLMEADKLGHERPAQHRQLCPRCKKMRAGWPDEWRNDLALPPGSVEYICGDCYRSSIMKLAAVRAAMQAWLTSYRERLNMPGEMAAFGPEAALEVLIPKLGRLYEEARALRTHFLVAQAAERSST